MVWVSRLAGPVLCHDAPKVALARAWVAALAGHFEEPTGWKPRVLCEGLDEEWHVGIGHRRSFGGRDFAGAAVAQHAFYCAVVVAQCRPGPAPFPPGQNTGQAGVATARPRVLNVLTRSWDVCEIRGLDALCSRERPIRTHGPGPSPGSDVGWSHAPW